MKTGDEIKIYSDGTYDGAEADHEGFGYQLTKVQCYNEWGNLLVNADVSAYQAQAVIAPIYVTLIMIGIGFGLGLIFNKIINKP